MHAKDYASLTLVVNHENVIIKCLVDECTNHLLGIIHFVFLSLSISEQKLKQVA